MAKSGQCLHSIISRLDALCQRQVLVSDGYVAQGEIAQSGIRDLLGSVEVSPGSGDGRLSTRPVKGVGDFTRSGPRLIKLADTIQGGGTSVGVGLINLGGNRGIARGGSQVAERVGPRSGLDTFQSSQRFIKERLVLGDNGDFA